MLDIPEYAKDQIISRTRELERVMLAAGVRLDSVSVPWRYAYVAACMRAMAELTVWYGAITTIKQGEVSIRIEGAKGFYWQCRERSLADALILAYETVEREKPTKKVGHG